MSVSPSLFHPSLGEGAQGGSPRSSHPVLPHCRMGLPEDYYRDAHLERGRPIGGGPKKVE